MLSVATFGNSWTVFGMPLGGPWRLLSDPGQLGSRAEQNDKTEHSKEQQNAAEYSSAADHSRD